MTNICSNHVFFYWSLLISTSNLVLAEQCDIYYCFGMKIQAILMVFVWYDTRSSVYDVYRVPSDSHWKPEGLRLSMISTCTGLAGTQTHSLPLRLLVAFPLQLFYALHICIRGEEFGNSAGRELLVQLGERYKCVSKMNVRCNCGYRVHFFPARNHFHTCNVHPVLDGSANTNA